MDYSKAIQFDKIPGELKTRNQWVLWKNITRGKDELPTKVPFKHDGTLAKANDPSTWCGFPLAVRAFREGDYAGIGYEFDVDDPYVGIDLDGCRDPETGRIAQWAREIIERFNTYTEVSPSGTGVKLWLRGDLPGNNGRKREIEGAEKISKKTPAIEIYSMGRYFAVTGWRVQGAFDPKPCQNAMDELIERLFPPQEFTDHAEYYSNDRVVERARKYMQRVPPSISGSGGHNAAFYAACVLCLGFQLDEQDARALLDEWNLTCQPPWSKRELNHKIKQAMKQGGERGYLRNAHPQNWPTIQVPKYRDAGSERLVTVRLDQVEAEKVIWVWEDRVAEGKLTVFAGEPGLGKSYLSLDMAAWISTGRVAPGSSTAAPPGSIVLLTAEDGLADTIRPRLDKMGADSSRIFAIQAVRSDDGERPFSLRRDLIALEETIGRAENCKLVIIDPISAYLGSADQNDNGAMRDILMQLAQLAERAGVAIVAITHLNKNEKGAAINRTTGSLAFVAAARTAWLLTSDGNAPGRRLFVCLKNNLSPNGTGLAFRIVDAQLVWESDPISIDANTALRASTRPNTPVVDWLRNRLAEGPSPAELIENEATEEGFTKKQLRLAKAKLKVTSRKSGFNTGWVLSLPSEAARPSDQDAHGVPLGKFEDDWAPSPIDEGSPKGGEGDLYNHELAVFPKNRFD